MGINGEPKQERSIATIAAEFWHYRHHHHERDLLFPDGTCAVSATRGSGKIMRKTHSERRLATG
jgi:hypothetical protein